MSYTNSIPVRQTQNGPELKTTQIIFQTIIQCLVEHNNIVILLMNSDHHKWQVTAFNLGVKDGKFTDKKSACTVKCTEYDFTLVTLSFLHESPYTDTFSHGRNIFSILVKYLWKLISCHYQRRWINVNEKDFIFSTYILHVLSTLTLTLTGQASAGLRV